MFDKQKKDTLSKNDRSKAGTVDEKVRELVDLINSKKNYYTTSSCAGRIVLLVQAEKKHQCEWLLCEHREVTIEELLANIKPTTKRLWFRMEPFILHVCCKDLDSAQVLIKHARTVGLKHSGIMSIEPRVMIELRGIDNLTILVAKEGQVIASEKYLGEVLPEANARLRKNYERIHKLLGVLTYERNNNDKES